PGSSTCESADITRSSIALRFTIPRVGCPGFASLSVRYCTGLTARSPAAGGVPMVSSGRGLAALDRLCARGGSMLFMHEVHRVKGAEAYAFERMYRDEWPRLVAGCGGARLLWYFNLAHGASVSYNVITMTAFTDWVAWETFACGVQSGALRDWTHE